MLRAFADAQHLIEIRYQTFLTRLAETSGIKTLARLDRKSRKATGALQRPAISGAPNVVSLATTSR